MTLASMINFDENALICDLAETYQIFDYRSLPVKLVAALSAGLRDDARIKLKASETPASLNTLLLAVIADRIEAIRYGLTADAAKGKNRPVSIVETLYGETSEKTGVAKFATGEQFEAALAKLRGE